MRCNWISWPLRYMVQHTGLAHLRDQRILMGPPPLKEFPAAMTYSPSEALVDPIHTMQVNKNFGGKKTGVGAII